MLCGLLLYDLTVFGLEIYKYWAISESPSQYPFVDSSRVFSAAPHAECTRVVSVWNRSIMGKS